MSQWVNNYSILHDLSVAQGRGVPGRINGVVAGDEKPPALHIVEDTEEQYFRQHMVGSGDSRAPPDLSLIQEMLKMVHITQPQQHKAATSMLNPNCAEFVPQYPPSLDINDNRYCPAKRDRNVALRSLLQADNYERSRTQNLRLLKPEDIIHTNMAYGREQPPYYLLSPQPIEMFKRKTPYQKIGFPQPIPEPNNNTYSVYEPSDFAYEYYNKCMERASFRNQVKEDIWAQAERKMKEIEIRKQKAAELAKQFLLKNGNQNLNLVRLAYHRHLIAEDCIVCFMVKKHNFNIDKFLSADKGV